MGIQDTNKIIRDFLITQAPLTALVGSRIYTAKPLPEGYALPAITFSTRGGSSSPYIPGIISPSVQFKCWSDDPVEAREVYGKLYDCLQGLQDHTSILSVIEEVQGQDLQDPTIPELYYVLTFFSFTIRAV